LPFSGGWIGNLSYELGRVIEPAVGPGRWRGEDDPWPLVEWGWCSWALVFDHLAGEWWLAGEMPKDWVWRRVSEGEDSFSCSEVRAVTGREAYLAAVERAIEYIRAGDIYQANIAQRFEADFSGSTRGLARAAMEAAQPWYGAYLELSPDRCAISMSPELFLEWNRRSGAMLTRPMKGTRPAACDAAVLERSIKDAAELAMIVDLMRNDLSRVSEIGSVRVARARAIESHPMVHQAVAEVVGCSRPGTSVADLIRAMFPGGSITGAPKIRAMQIIDELETHSRGPMFGAIGAWDDLGRATLGMAIRTMWIRGGAKPGRIGFLERASVEYASGCGIVVESDPEGENLECFHKLEAFRRALRSPPERAALSRSRRPKGAESQVSTPATSALLQMRTACGR
jgi:para-aminobenzoate synthetase component 1